DRRRGLLGQSAERPVVIALSSNWAVAGMPLPAYQQATAQACDVPRSTVTLSEALRGMLLAKRAANLRPATIKELLRYLGKFIAGRENTPIAAVSVGDLESWFAGRSEGPKTRQGSVGRLSSLSGYAERRGWIPFNPCRRLERIRLEFHPPRILSVREAARLMG